MPKGGSRPGAGRKPKYAEINQAQESLNLLKDIEDLRSMLPEAFSILEQGACQMTHGEAGTRRTAEYTVWVTVKDRCLDPTSKAFPYYGGRGVKICEEWLHDYAAFLAHIGRRPSSDHQIDRINNCGNYEPGNVRWATRKEQCRNSGSGIKWRMTISIHPV